MGRKAAYLTSRNMGKVVGGWMEELEAEASYHRERLDTLPRTTALIIIDMQRFFVYDGGHAYLPAARAVLPNVVRLRDAFRSSGRKVVYTRHGHVRRGDHAQMGRWWADMLMASSPEAVIVDELKPGRDETVIRKQTYDAFQGTELLYKMKDWGVTHVVITGVMTHICCETTARSAFTNDFEVVMAADGMASSDEQYHIGTLRSAAHAYAVPFTTEEIQERLGGDD